MLFCTYVKKTNVKSFDTCMFTYSTIHSRTSPCLSVIFKRNVSPKRLHRIACVTYRWKEYMSKSRRVYLATKTTERVRARPTAITDCASYYCTQSMKCTLMIGTLRIRILCEIIMLLLSRYS